MLHTITPQKIAILLAVLLLIAGCSPRHPIYLGGNGDMSSYRDYALEIEEPNVETPVVLEVTESTEPFSLENDEPKERWQLELKEAVHIALKNSRVLRQLGGGTFNWISSRQDMVATMYDPAMADYYVQQARSLWDAQFSLTTGVTQNNTPMNPALGLGIWDNYGDHLIVNQGEQFDTTAQISKKNATGGEWFITHAIGYDDPRPSGVKYWDETWDTSLGIGFKQPLLQGAGVQFNRIAGSAGSLGQGGPNRYDGIMIATLNTNVALVDFQIGVRDMVRDVEKAYWSLSLAYRRLESAVAGQRAALNTWREIHAGLEAGTQNIGAESQAREQYFNFRQQVEVSLHSIFTAEAQLRNLMGLASNDGRLIQPTTKPDMAPFDIDWRALKREAIEQRAEVRRAKWRVKQRELELVGAKNFLLPELNLTGGITAYGLGGRLTGDDGDPRSGHRSAAYPNMAEGDHVNYNLGLELIVPIGNRQAMAEERRAKLALARERAILQETILDIDHQISDAIRSATEFSKIIQTTYNRRIAAEEEKEVREKSQEVNSGEINLVLDAQKRLALAEVAYYESLVNYTIARTDIEYSKGTLLRSRGVCLSESEWTEKAKFDARNKAKARSAGLYLNYGFTRPGVVSRGAVDQGCACGDCPSCLTGSVVDDAVLGSNIEVLPPEANVINGVKLEATKAEEAFNQDPAELVVPPTPDE